MNSCSMYGIIKSAWQYNEDDTITYKVTVPANTTARIILQQTERSAFTGELDKEKGIEKIIESYNQIEILLGSGEYVFNYRTNM